MSGRIIVLASTLIFWPVLPVWGGYKDDVLSDGPVAYWRLGETEADLVRVHAEPGEFGKSLLDTEDAAYTWHRITKIARRRMARHSSAS